MPLRRSDLEPRSVPGRAEGSEAVGRSPVGVVLSHWRPVWIVVGGVVLVAVAVAFLLSRGASGRPSSREILGLAPAASDSGAGGEITEPATAPGAGKRLVVHVAGAVLVPGVYRLPDPSRVVDAVNAAGGGSEDSNLAAVNLAALLVDGSQVYVPRKGEGLGGAAGGGGVAGGVGGGTTSPAQKVNINSASDRDLDSLPGVGPATAAKIVTYRREHGRFRSVDELRNVAGIGDAKLAEIRPMVTV